MKNYNLYGVPLPENTEYVSILPEDKDYKYEPAISFSSFEELYEYAVSCDSHVRRQSIYESDYYSDLKIILEIMKPPVLRGTIPSDLRDLSSFGNVKQFIEVNYFLYILFENGVVRYIRLRKKLPGVKAIEEQNRIFTEHYGGIKKLGFDFVLKENGELIPFSGSKDNSAEAMEIIKYSGQVEAMYCLSGMKYILLLKDGTFVGLNGAASAVNKCRPEKIIVIFGFTIIKSKTGKFYFNYYGTIHPVPDILKIFPMSRYNYCIDRNNRYIRLNDLIKPDRYVNQYTIENIIDVLTLHTSERTMCDISVYLFKDGTTIYDEIEETFNQSANVTMRLKKGFVHGPDSIKSIHYCGNSIVGVKHLSQNDCKEYYCRKMAAFAEITKKKYLDPGNYYIHSKRFRALVEVSLSDLEYIKNNEDLYNEFKNHPILYIMTNEHKPKSTSNSTVNFALPVSDDVDDIAAAIDAIYYLKTKGLRKIRFVIYHDAPETVTADTIFRYDCCRMDYNDEYFHRAESILFNETKGVEENDPDYVFEE